MPVTNVALGVGGGIAAYKAAELARALMERGFSVQVLMTRSAEEFVRPLTFAALTGRKVITNLFSGASAEDTLASAIEHIRVAQENQILVIAPATANLPRPRLNSSCTSCLAIPRSVSTRWACCLRSWPASVSSTRRPRR